MSEKELKVIEGGKKTEKIKKEHIATVYFGGPHAEVLERMKAIHKEFSQISVSALVVTACEASIDTYEKEIPRKRRFKLNGVCVDV